MALMVGKEARFLFYAVTGDEFPDTNEDLLRALAEAWYAAGHQLNDKLGPELRRAVNKLGSSFAGQAEQAFAVGMAPFVAGRGNYVDSAGDFFRRMGETLEQIALDAEYMKYIVILELAMLKLEMEFATASYFIFGPLSIVWFSGRLAFVRELIVGVVKWFKTRLRLLGKLDKFSRSIVIGSGTGTPISLGNQVVVTVAAQVFQFLQPGKYKRHEMNKEYLVDAAVVGAFGGAMAPVAHGMGHGLNKLLDKALTAAGRTGDRHKAFAHHLSHIISESLHEGLTATFSTAALTGHFAVNWADFTAGASSGVGRVAGHLFGVFLTKLTIAAMVANIVPPHFPARPHGPDGHGGHGDDGPGGGPGGGYGPARGGRPGGAPNGHTPDGGPGIGEKADPGLGGPRRRGRNDQRYPVVPVPQAYGHARGAGNGATTGITPANGHGPVRPSTGPVTAPLVNGRVHGEANLVPPAGAHGHPANAGPPEGRTDPGADSRTDSDTDSLLSSGSSRRSISGSDAFSLVANSDARSSTTDLTGPHDQTDSHSLADPREPPTQAEPPLVGMDAPPGRPGEVQPDNFAGDASADRVRPDLPSGVPPPASAMVPENRAPGSATAKPGDAAENGSSKPERAPTARVKRGAGPLVAKASAPGMGPKRARRATARTSASAGLPAKATVRPKKRGTKGKANAPSIVDEPQDDFAWNEKRVRAAAALLREQQGPLNADRARRASEIVDQVHRRSVLVKRGLYDDVVVLVAEKLTGTGQLYAPKFARELARSLGTGWERPEASKPEWLQTGPAGGMPDAVIWSADDLALTSGWHQSFVDLAKLFNPVQVFSALKFHDDRDTREGPEVRMSSLMNSRVPELFGSGLQKIKDVARRVEDGRKGAGALVFVRPAGKGRPGVWHLTNEGPKSGEKNDTIVLRTFDGWQVMRSVLAEFTDAFGGPDGVGEVDAVGFTANGGSIIEDTLDNRWKTAEVDQSLAHADGFLWGLKEEVRTRLERRAGLIMVANMDTAELGVVYQPKVKKAIAHAMGLRRYPAGGAAVATEPEAIEVGLTVARSLAKKLGIAVPLAAPLEEMVLSFDLTTFVAGIILDSGEGQARSDSGNLARFLGTAPTRESQESATVPADRARAPERTGETTGGESPDPERAFESDIGSPMAVDPLVATDPADTDMRGSGLPSSERIGRIERAARSWPHWRAATVRGEGTYAENLLAVLDEEQREELLRKARIFALTFGSPLALGDLRDAVHWVIAHTWHSTPGDVATKDAAALAKSEELAEAMDAVWDEDEVRANMAVSLKRTKISESQWEEARAAVGAWHDATLVRHKKYSDFQVTLLVAGLAKDADVREVAKVLAKVMGTAPSPVSRPERESNQPGVALRIEATFAEERLRLSVADDAERRKLVRRGRALAFVFADPALLLNRKGGDLRDAAAWVVADTWYSTPGGEAVKNNAALNKAAELFASYRSWEKEGFLAFARDARSRAGIGEALWAATVQAVWVHHDEKLGAEKGYPIDDVVKVVATLAWDGDLGVDGVAVIAEGVTKALGTSRPIGENPLFRNLRTGRGRPDTAGTAHPRVGWHSGNLPERAKVAKSNLSGLPGGFRGAQWKQLRSETLAVIQVRLGLISLHASGYRDEVAYIVADVLHRQGIEAALRTVEDMAHDLKMGWTQTDLAEILAEAEAEDEDINDEFRALVRAGVLAYHDPSKLGEMGFSIDDMVTVVGYVTDTERGLVTPHRASMGIAEALGTRRQAGVTADAVTAVGEAAAEAIAALDMGVFHELLPYTKLGLAITHGRSTLAERDDSGDRHGDDVSWELPGFHDDILWVLTRTLDYYRGVDGNVTEAGIEAMLDRSDDLARQLDTTWREPDLTEAAWEAWTRSIARDVVDQAHAVVPFDFDDRKLVPFGRSLPDMIRIVASLADTGPGDASSESTLITVERISRRIAASLGAVRSPDRAARPVRRDQADRAVVLIDLNDADLEALDAERARIWGERWESFVRRRAEGTTRDGEDGPSAEGLPSTKVSDQGAHEFQEIYRDRLVALYGEKPGKPGIEIGRFPSHWLPAGSDNRVDPESVGAGRDGVDTVIARLDTPGAGPFPRAIVYEFDPAGGPVRVLNVVPSGEQTGPRFSVVGPSGVPLSKTEDMALDSLKTMYALAVATDGSVLIGGRSFQKSKFGGDMVPPEPGFVAPPRNGVRPVPEEVAVAPARAGTSTGPSRDFDAEWRRLGLDKRLATATASLEEAASVDPEAAERRRDRASAIVATTADTSGLTEEQVRRLSKLVAYRNILAIRGRFDGVYLDAEKLARDLGIALPEGSWVPADFMVKRGRARNIGEALAATEWTRARATVEAEFARDLLPPSALYHHESATRHAIVYRRHAPTAPGASTGSALILDLIAYTEHFTRGTERRKGAAMGTVSAGLAEALDTAWRPGTLRRLERDAPTLGGLDQDMVRRAREAAREHRETLGRKHYEIGNAVRVAAHLEATTEGLRSEDVIIAMAESPIWTGDRLRRREPGVIERLDSLDTWMRRAISDTAAEIVVSEGDPNKLDDLYPRVRLAVSEALLGAGSLEERVGEALILSAEMATDLDARLPEDGRKQAAGSRVRDVVARAEARIGNERAAYLQTLFPWTQGLLTTENTRSLKRLPSLWHRDDNLVILASGILFASQNPLVLRDFGGLGATINVLADLVYSFPGTDAEKREAAENLAVVMADQLGSRWGPEMVRRMLPEAPALARIDEEVKSRASAAAEERRADLLAKHYQVDDVVRVAALVVKYVESVSVEAVIAAIANSPQWTPKRVGDLSLVPVRPIAEQTRREANEILSRYHDPDKLEDAGRTSGVPELAAKVEELIARVLARSGNATANRREAELRAAEMAADLGTGRTSEEVTAPEPSTAESSADESSAGEPSAAQWSAGETGEVASGPDAASATEAPTTTTLTQRGGAADPDLVEDGMDLSESGEESDAESEGWDEEPDEMDVDEAGVPDQRTAESPDGGNAQEALANDTLKVLAATVAGRAASLEDIQDVGGLLEALVRQSAAYHGRLSYDIGPDSTFSGPQHGGVVEVTAKMVEKWLAWSGDGASVVVIGYPQTGRGRALYFERRPDGSHVWDPVTGTWDPPALPLFHSSFAIPVASDGTHGRLDDAVPNRMTVLREVVNGTPPNRQAGALPDRATVESVLTDVVGIKEVLRAHRKFDKNPRRVDEYSLVALGKGASALMRAGHHVTLGGHGADATIVFYPRGTRGNDGPTGPGHAVHLRNVRNEVIWDLGTAIGKSDKVYAIARRGDRARLSLLTRGGIRRRTGTGRHRSIPDQLKELFGYQDETQLLESLRGFAGSPIELSSAPGRVTDVAGLAEIARIVKKHHLGHLPDGGVVQFFPIRTGSEGEETVRDRWSWAVQNKEVWSTVVIGYHAPESATDVGPHREGRAWALLKKGKGVRLYRSDGTEVDDWAAEFGRFGPIYTSPARADGGIPRGYPMAGTTARMLLRYPPGTWMNFSSVRRNVVDVSGLYEAFQSDARFPAPRLISAAVERAVGEFRERVKRFGGRAVVFAYTTRKLGQAWVFDAEYDGVLFNQNRWIRVEDGFPAGRYPVYGSAWDTEGNNVTGLPLYRPQAEILAKLVKNGGRLSLQQVAQWVTDVGYDDLVTVLNWVGATDGLGLDRTKMVPPRKAGSGEESQRDALKWLRTAEERSFVLFIGYWGRGEDKVGEVWLARKQVDLATGEPILTEITAKRVLRRPVVRNVDDLFVAKMVRRGAGLYDLAETGDDKPEPAEDTSAVASNSVTSYSQEDREWASKLLDAALEDLRAYRNAEVKGFSGSAVETEVINIVAQRLREEKEDVAPSGSAVEQDDSRELIAEEDAKIAAYWKAWQIVVSLSGERSALDLNSDVAKLLVRASGMGPAIPLSTALDVITGVDGVERALTAVSQEIEGERSIWLPQLLEKGERVSGQVHRAVLDFFENDRDAKLALIHYPPGASNDRGRSWIGTYESVVDADSGAVVTYFSDLPPDGTYYAVAIAGDRSDPAIELDDGTDSSLASEGDADTGPVDAEDTPQWTEELVRTKAERLTRGRYTAEDKQQAARLLETAHSELKEQTGRGLANFDGQHLEDHVLNLIATTFHERGEPGAKLLAKSIVEDLYAQQISPEGLRAGAPSTDDGEQAGPATARTGAERFTGAWTAEDWWHGPGSARDDSVPADFRSFLLAGEGRGAIFEGELRGPPYLAPFPRYDDVVFLDDNLALLAFFLKRFGYRGDPRARITSYVPELLGSIDSISGLPQKPSFQSARPGTVGILMPVPGPGEPGVPRAWGVLKDGTGNLNILNAGDDQVTVSGEITAEFSGNLYAVLFDPEKDSVVIGGHQPTGPTFRFPYGYYDGVDDVFRLHRVVHKALGAGYSRDPRELMASLAPRFIGVDQVLRTIDGAGHRAAAVLITEKRGKRRRGWYVINYHGVVMILEIRRGRIRRVGRTSDALTDLIGFWSVAVDIHGNDIGSKKVRFLDWPGGEGGDALPAGPELVPDPAEALPMSDLLRLDAAGEALDYYWSHGDKFGPALPDELPYAGDGAHGMTLLVLALLSRGGPASMLAAGFSEGEGEAVNLVTGGDGYGEVFFLDNDNNAQRMYLLKAEIPGRIYGFTRDDRNEPVAVPFESTPATVQMLPDLDREWFDAGFTYPAAAEEFELRLVDYLVDTYRGKMEQELRKLVRKLWAKLTEAERGAIAVGNPRVPGATRHARVVVREGNIRELDALLERIIDLLVREKRILGWTGIHGEIVNQRRALRNTAAADRYYAALAARDAAPERRDPRVEIELAEAEDAMRAGLTAPYLRPPLSSREAEAYDRKGVTWFGREKELPADHPVPRKAEASGAQIGSGVSEPVYRAVRAGKLLNDAEAAELNLSWIRNALYVVRKNTKRNTYHEVMRAAELADPSLRYLDNFGRHHTLQPLKPKPDGTFDGTLDEDAPLGEDELRENVAVNGVFPDEKAFRAAIFLVDHQGIGPFLARRWRASGDGGPDTVVRRNPAPPRASRSPWNWEKVESETGGAALSDYPEELARVYRAFAEHPYHFELLHSGRGSSLILTVAKRLRSDPGTDMGGLLSDIAAGLGLAPAASDALSGPLGDGFTHIEHFHAALDYYVSHFHYQRALEVGGEVDRSEPFELVMAREPVPFGKARSGLEKLIRIVVGSGDGAAVIVIEQLLPSRDLRAWVLHNDRGTVYLVNFASGTSAEATPEALDPRSGIAAMAGWRDGKVASGIRRPRPDPVAGPPRTAELVRERDLKVRAVAHVESIRDDWRERHRALMTIDAVREGAAEVEDVGVDQLRAAREIVNATHDTGKLRELALFDELAMVVANYLKEHAGADATAGAERMSSDLADLLHTKPKAPATLEPTRRHARPEEGSSPGSDDGPVRKPSRLDPTAFMVRLPDDTDAFRAIFAAEPEAAGTFMRTLVGEKPGDRDSAWSESSTLADEDAETPGTRLPSPSAVAGLAGGPGAGGDLGVGTGELAGGKAALAWYATWRGEPWTADTVLVNAPGPIQRLLGHAPELAGSGGRGLARVAARLTEDRAHAFVVDYRSDATGRRVGRVRTMVRHREQLYIVDDGAGMWRLVTPETVEEVGTSLGLGQVYAIVTGSDETFVAVNPPRERIAPGEKVSRYDLVEYAHLARQYRMRVAADAGDDVPVPGVGRLVQWLGGLRLVAPWAVTPEFASDLSTSMWRDVIALVVGADPEDPPRWLLFPPGGRPLPVRVEDLPPATQALF